MKQFKKILFISRGNETYQNSAYHAIKLALNNNAEIEFLIISDSLPKELHEHEQKIKKGYINNFEQYIDQQCSALNISKHNFKFTISMCFSDWADIKITQKVFTGNHDLIIKSIDEVKKGFKSFDMSLLRNVPCPIWFFRLGNSNKELNKIAAAIDANRTDETNIKLSMQIVSNANSLANIYHSSLDIISCWKPSVSKSMADNSFLNIPKEEIENIQKNEQDQLKQNIIQIIEKSEIGQENNCNFNILKGLPEKQIPEFIINHDIQILVMGTVARTGLPGFFIGNTAENILHKITCSLLALKPEGFVSPVKLED